VSEANRIMVTIDFAPVRFASLTTPYIGACNPIGTGFLW